MYFLISTVVEEKWRMEPCNNTRFKTLGSCFSFEALEVKIPLTTIVWCFLLLLSDISQKGIGLVVSTMATKMKGIYKGFKYISQIFVVKEREMEIGYPTDVKHVAHIGWDGPSGSGSAPSWMTEFKTAPDFSATSLGNIGEPRDSNSNTLSTWSSQDFEQSMGRHPASEMFKDFPPTDLPNVPKKHKRKKTRSTSSPKSSSSSRSSRAAKSKAPHIGMEATTELQA